MPYETDIFVVGGGPAGLAMAIAGRQAGLNVMVADGAQPPIDKACGEGFLPDGVEALRRLGLQIAASEIRPFRGIRFRTDSRSAEAVFPSGGCGLAIRRTVLHRALIERAQSLGADLLWGSPVTGISHDGVYVGGHFVSARWIVGADGSNSRVRRWARLDRTTKPKLRYAFRRHFRVRPWTDHMEVYWGKRCQGYATAVSEDQVCIAVASADPHLRIDDGLRELPRLAERLSGAEVISTERGALTGNCRLRRVSQGNVVLIGDASGTVDAITGEGMGLAFRQAAVLAECLSSDDLSRYEGEHRNLALRPRIMARMMLNLDRRPWLQERTLQVFAERPLIFRRLLEFHIGCLPASRLLGDGLTLGWGLLTA